MTALSLLAGRIVDIDICVHTYSPLRDVVLIQCISRIFVKITMAMLMGAMFHKTGYKNTNIQ